MKIAFLLGSGMSIAAGMPNITELTKLILDGNKFIRRPEFIGPPPMGQGGYILDISSHGDANVQDKYLQAVLYFLEVLKAEIDCYYASFQMKFRHLTTYEDLYYVAKQIEESTRGSRDNPAVQLLCEKVFTQVSPFLRTIGFTLRTFCDSSEKALQNQVCNIADLSKEATNYIHDAVGQLLDTSQSKLLGTTQFNLDRLCYIKDAYQDAEISRVDIATLNHDTVIEQYLGKNGIRLPDGFDKPVNGRRFWNPNLFLDDSIRSSLLKLHGSINWFNFPYDKERMNQTVISLLSPQNPMQEAQDPDLWGRPVFLVGTFNKMMEYAFGIYVELYYHFHRRLNSTQRLVVIGYGFGDQAINFQIREWMNSSTANRMIIIDLKSKDELVDRAKFVFCIDWGRWESEGRVKYEKEKIEDLAKKLPWQQFKEKYLTA